MKKYILLAVAAILLLTCGIALGLYINLNQQSEPTISQPPATMSSGETSEETPITTSSGLALSQNGFCIINICIQEKMPYFEVGEYYVQISYMSGYDTTPALEYAKELPEKNADGYYVTNTEGSKALHIRKTGGSGSLIANDVMMTTKTLIQEISKGVFLVQEISGGCGGTSIKQKFVNDKNKSITFDSLEKTYPKSLNVGSIKFNSYWTEDSIAYLFSRIGYDGVSEVNEVFSIKDDVGAKLLKMIVDNKNFVGSYAIKFKEYPGIVFIYKSDFLSADRVIFLGNDATWKEANLDKNGNILDFALTKKILGYYEMTSTGGMALIYNRQVLRKGDENYDKITTENLTGSHMPIFRVAALDTAGNYLLYTAEKYSSTIMAELCKPVVYVYDTNNGANSLTVGFPRGGDFTTLIPKFSNDTTWDFKANTSSRIHVANEGKQFDYLYYSAKVPHYEYNMNGWQVYGRDIESFFGEKLDYIGFNKQEKKDFIEYWVTEFDPNTLYFVSFKFDETIDQYVSLDFSRKPTKQMRVLLEAYPMPGSPNQKFLWPQVGKRLDSYILKVFDRSNEFDVFEWGGTLEKKAGGGYIIY